MYGFNWVTRITVFNLLRIPDILVGYPESGDQKRHKSKQYSDVKVFKKNKTLTKKEPRSAREKSDSPKKSLA